MAAARSSLKWHSSYRLLKLNPAVLLVSIDSEAPNLVFEVLPASATDIADDLFYSSVYFAELSRGLLSVFVSWSATTVYAWDVPGLLKAC